VVNAAEADAKAPARTDPRGDPLPAGALLRIGTVRYRSGPVNAAALAPDGKTLATASARGITLWEVASGRPLHRLRNSGVPYEFSANQALLCFSPDGQRLVSLAEVILSPPYGRRPVVRVWDVSTGEEVARFDLPAFALPEETERWGLLPARYVWFTPGGKELGVVLRDGVVRFLDPSSGKETRHWEIGQSLREAYPGVATSPDGKLLSVADARDGRAILLFDVATGRRVRRLAVASKPEVVTFSPDSAVLAVADDGPAVRLFDVATGKESGSFAASAPGAEESLQGSLALAFSPDGKTLYAGSRTGPVLRWRLPAAEAVPPMARATVNDPDARSPAATGIFPSPDGRSVTTVGWRDDLIRHWDAATGKEIPPPDGFSGRVCCRLSPGAWRVAVGDSAGKLALFETATGRLSRVLRAEGPVVATLCWSADGKTLATGQGDDTVRLWDVASGREVHVLRLPRNRDPSATDSLAFSPDARRLLVSRQKLRMFDVATGRELWAGSHSGAVLSPDGQTVAACANDGLVLLDAATGGVRATHRIGDRVPGLPFEAELAFAPDGRLLAVSHPDGSIRLHDTKTGEVHSPFRTLSGGRTSTPCFSPDGKWLAVVSGGELRLWEVFPGIELTRLAVSDDCKEPELGPGLRTVVAPTVDGTVLVWDLASRGVPGAEVDPWAALASADGKRVYAVARALRDNPKDTVALLRQKLPPAEPGQEGRARQLVARLDDEAFAEREKATNELLELGSPAVPLLKKLQAEAASAEVRRRLQGIVEILTGREAPDVRHERAVQVLEMAATVGARRLLREWSAGAPSAALAEDARAALGRLERADKARRALDKP
jgi:WD40 repeat protein